MVARPDPVGLVLVSVPVLAPGTVPPLLLLSGAAATSAVPDPGLVSVPVGTIVGGF